MKRYKKLFLLILFSICFNLIKAQNNISKENILIQKNIVKDFNNLNLKKKNFSMNQHFSLSSSFNNNGSQTIGVFSNFSNHKLSEKLEIKTAFHLIQNNNQLSNLNANQTGLSYELGLEYKINPNSFLSLQILNYKNLPNH